MVSEPEVGSWQFKLRHVARGAIGFRSSRTKLRVTRSTCQIGRLQCDLAIRAIMGMVASGASDSTIDRVVALGSRNSIRLESDVADATGAVCRDISPSTVTLSADLGDLLRRDLAEAGGPNRGPNRVLARVRVTTHALNAGYQRLSPFERSPRDAWSRRWLCRMASEAFEHSLRRELTTQGLF